MKEKQKTKELEESKEITPEVVSVPATIEKKLPIAISELAIMKDEEGIQVIENRFKAVLNLRMHSIALTWPSDWNLYRTQEGVVTGYCSDAGCKKFWQLWDIAIYPKFGFETVRDDDNPRNYAVMIRGDGYSDVTKTDVYDVFGTAFSEDEFFRGLSPLFKRVRMQQKAIANRDGNIIRNLTGMKIVPIELIESVWLGSGKDIRNCNYARGFGTRVERLGAQIQQEDSIPPEMEPTCSKHKGMKMRFYPAGKSRTSGRPYAAFWSCSVQGCKETKRHSEVLAQVKDQMSAVPEEKAKEDIDEKSKE